jgi:predicted transcriptional regulator of viral defense system
MNGRETDLTSFLKKRGGLASYAEILKAGLDKTFIKNALNSGRIQKIERALYRLSEDSSLLNPDLVAISIKVPKGVICLLSALSFHEVTNEIPKCVDVAILRGAHANKIKYPPVKFYRFSDKAWKAGTEEHKIEGHNVKIYSLPKTIADCFKFRNKIGIDVARSALKVAVMEKGINPKDIMQYAKICRVANIIKPILEAII